MPTPFQGGQGAGPNGAPAPFPPGGPFPGGFPGQGGPPAPYPPGGPFPHGFPGVPSSPTPGPLVANVMPGNHQTLYDDRIIETKMVQTNDKVIEVPQTVEVPKVVYNVEVKETTREVPRPEVKYVDRIIEVPQVTNIDRVVEVPTVQEVTRHVPKVEIVDVPVTKVVYVPKIEIQTVEQVRYVPVYQVIDVPVEHEVLVAKEVPYVQTVERPVPTEEVVDVDVPVYVPQYVPVPEYVDVPQYVDVVREVPNPVPIPAYTDYKYSYPVEQIEEVPIVRASALPYSQWTPGIGFHNPQFGVGQPPPHLGEPGHRHMESIGDHHPPAPHAFHGFAEHHVPRPPPAPREDLPTLFDVSNPFASLLASLEPGGPRGPGGFGGPGPQSHGPTLVAGGQHGPHLGGVVHGQPPGQMPIGPR